MLSLVLKKAIACDPHAVMYVRGPSRNVPGTRAIGLRREVACCHDLEYRFIWLRRQSRRTD